MIQSLIQTDIAITESTNHPPLPEEHDNHLKSVALHSQTLGFEVCLFSDGCYRAHMLNSDVWGRRWSLASLAVYEGFEMTSKASFL